MFSDDPRPDEIKSMKFESFLDASGLQSHSGRVSTANRPAIFVKYIINSNYSPNKNKN